MEFIRTHTHHGTHLDSALHLLEDGKSLDDYPLQQFIGEGAIIDASGKPPNGVIELEEVKSEYDRYIEPGEIVVIRTGWCERIGFTEIYMKQFPRITLDLAKWLVEEKKIKLLGTDMPSWDEYPSKTYPVHKYLLGQGGLLVEKMNLPKELLDRKRWWWFILPLPLKGAAGVQCRAIAVEWE